MRDREKAEKLFEAWEKNEVTGYQISQETGISQPLLYRYRHDISKIGKMANEKVEALADLYDKIQGGKPKKKVSKV